MTYHGGYPDPDPIDPDLLDRMISKTDRDAIVGAAIAAHHGRFDAADRIRARASDGYARLHDRFNIDPSDYGWGLEGAR